MKILLIFLRIVEVCSFLLIALLIIKFIDEPTVDLFVAIMLLIIAEALEKLENDSE